MNNTTKQSSAYRKGYKQGYNNPGQFNQDKLLNNNSDMAQGVVAGICQRKQDDANNTRVFE